MAGPSKKQRVLASSQAGSVSKLNARQLEDEALRNNKNRLRNVDPLQHQQSIIQHRIKELREDLPHLYGYPWYKWAKEFFESRNRMNLLVAGNQLSKSSSAIRKNIEWACNKKLWPELWETTPKIFWYFYPTESVAAVEFEKKWVPEFLPRGAMKNHSEYGWDVEYTNGTLTALHFKSGVTIYFKTYGQKVVNLQTATIHMVTADEEIDEIYVDELLARLRSTRGYFNQVFTATRGLQLWYRAMECIGSDDEAFRSAFKQSVSMYDCQFYEDGTPSKWTLERIHEAEAQCTSKREILKRIMGRFVRDEGLRYEPFDPDKNVVPAVPTPKNWRHYAAVDIGSGGGKGRSSGAIVIVAVDPTNTLGRVVRSWRGNNEETTAADILARYRLLRHDINITQASYDYASREFGIIAARAGEGFIRADKARVTGEATINTLFKSGALLIEAGEYHNQKLVTELMSVPGGPLKNRSYVDDLTDSLKYACSMIPWDFAKLTPGESRKYEEVRDEVPEASWSAQEYVAWEIRQRRGEADPKAQSKGWAEFEAECDEWNEAYGS
jgi:hypothetical protein